MTVDGDYTFFHMIQLGKEGNQKDTIKLCNMIYICLELQEDKMAIFVLQSTLFACENDRRIFLVLSA